MPRLTITSDEEWVILEECRQRREENERRFSPPSTACQYGCNLSGWRPVEPDEDQTPRPTEIFIGTQLMTPCQCNVGAGGRVRYYPSGYQQ